MRSRSGFPPRLRWIATLALVGCLAVACSRGDGLAIEIATPSPDNGGGTGADVPAPAPSPTATPTVVPTPTPEPVGRAELPEDFVAETGDRLAIETGDGQILTMRPDGSNVAPLTDPAEGTVNEQVRWSVDAGRLAWVSSDGGPGARLRSARFDGSDWSDLALDVQPFGLAWDATSTQIATVSTTDSGAELGVVTTDADGAAYTALDRGSPMWFWWSPDADAFVVHASVLRLDRVPIDGPVQVLERNPGSFGVPVWIPGPVPLVYADERDEAGFLVAAGEAGGGRRPLVTYDGYLQFTVAPQSGYVALRVLDAADAPVPEVITALRQPDDLTDPVDEVDVGELVVIALFGGDPLVLWPSPFPTDPGPVRAFYWSPDGTTLAWLVEVTAGDGDCTSETSRLQWQFWDGAALFDGPTFSPSATFACDYLPAFDQNAQSLTYFSPDGSQLVYAGTDPLTGERGVFVADIGSFTPPSLVADGEHAVWSPAPAGSSVSSSL